MKNVLLLVFLPLFLLQCQNNRPAEGTESTEIKPVDDLLIVPGERVGMITAETTEATLEKMYGAENLKMQRIGVSEGEEQEGVVLFPGTEKELEIIWQSAASEGKPAFVRITRDSTLWKTSDGITIGSSLEDLEKANGAPFIFNGFEWDYSGLVTDWKGGQFTSNLLVALVPQDFNAMTPNMMGEVNLSSDDAKVRAIQAKIGSIVVTFP